MKTAVHPAFQPRRNEIYAHTSLRGIAALCVVAYHGTLFFRPAEGGGFIYDFMGNSHFFVDLFVVSKIEADTGLSLTSSPGLTIPVAICIGLAAGFANYLWVEWPIERVAQKRRGPFQAGAGT